MQTTLAEAALLLGTSPRAARYQAHSGALGQVREVGGTLLVDAHSLTALRRSRGRGRRWNAATRATALALLDGRADRYLDSSATSRLRSVLRALDAAGFAYRMGNIGIAGHYSFAQGTARELARRVTRSGASALDSQTLADLGVEPDRTRLIGYTDDLGGLADDFLLNLDDDGGLLLIETLELPHAGAALYLLDGYLYGDARVSGACGREFERRLAAVA